LKLSLYNTITRKKCNFVPLDSLNVRMYLCGPTVYDNAHIGNARSMIVFDVLYRLLRCLYGTGSVTYVRNITDIDDKINQRALRDHPDLPANEAIRLITERTNTRFQKDMEELYCLPPSFQPRATGHIQEMVTIIQRLLSLGYAYETHDHVFFHVPSAKQYGDLARRQPGDQDDEVDQAQEITGKRNPADFVLWKPSPPGIPCWPSPWGPGRPGWHIECSAMSWKYLGEVFDIHCGGSDLIFPHHENEIIQSTCAFGTEMMAQIWLHNGLVLLEGQKMSKSLGNDISVCALLEDWPGEVLRFNILKTHYRQQLDWKLKDLKEAFKILCDWHRSVNETSSTDPDTPDQKLNPDFLEAISDDLNTPRGLSVLHGLRHQSLDDEEIRDQFIASLSFLGLLNQAPIERSRTSEKRISDLDTSLIESLISERLSARERKDFATSDRIRDKLSDMGVQVKDDRDSVTGKPICHWSFS